MRIFSRLHILLTLVVTAVAAQSHHASAQDVVESYKFDFGAGLGMSGYLGDANESNLFKHPGFAADIAARYLFDSRWAVRAQLSMATLSGNTADFDNVLPGNASYEFKSTVYDLGVRGECNFFAYGIGETYKRLRRWTPFLSLGVGVTMSANGSGSSYVAFNIPMGIGVKYKFAPRWNLIAEFTMTKTFGDKIDSDELTDIYQIKSSFLKNTDWYSTLTVGVSFEFGPRCVTCHRID